MTYWSQRNFAHGGLRRWLQAPGSLSARLAATGAVFSVQVLRQGRQPLTWDEVQALGNSRGCAGQRCGYVREVVLKVDGVAKVFARSVTAHVNSLGPWRSVRGLGSRPLADVLFTRSGISRQPLAFGKLALASQMQRHAAVGWQRATGQSVARTALPARRSIFVRRGAGLLVMETFVAPDVQWQWTETAAKVKTTHRRRV